MPAHPLTDDTPQPGRYDADAEHPHPPPHRFRPRDPRSVPLVADLVRHGLVEPGRQGDAVRAVDRSLTGDAVPASGLRQRLAELGGYVGGSFVVAATGLIVVDRWDSLGAVQQVALLAGIAVVLALAGLSLALVSGGLTSLRRGDHPARRRLASVLASGSAAVSSAAAVIVVVHLLEGDAALVERGHLAGLAGSVALFVVAGAGYLLAPSVVGQLVIAAGAVYAVAFGLDAVGDIEPVRLGLLVLAVGVIWLALAETGRWNEVLAGRLLGAVLVVVGAQIPVVSDDAWVGYLTTGVVAVLGFASYASRRAWPYLAAGVVGVTVVVPEALLDWTGGSLGTAGALLAAGVTLLVASLLGMRLRSEVAETGREAAATATTRDRGSR